MHFTILRFATLWCKLGLHRLLALRILRMHILQHCVWQQCGASPAFTESLRSASAHMHFTILRLATVWCKPDLHRILVLCILRICILQHCVLQQCGASPAFTESLCSVSCAYAFHNTVFGKNAVQAQPSQNPCALHPAHARFTTLRLATVWCKPSLHRFIALRVLCICFYNTALGNNAVQAQPSQILCALRPVHMHFTTLRFATVWCKPGLHIILALCILRICILQYCVLQQCGASPAFTESFAPHPACVRLIIQHSLVTV